MPNGNIDKVESLRIRYVLVCPYPLQEVCIFLVVIIAELLGPRSDQTWQLLCCLLEFFGAFRSIVLGQGQRSIKFALSTGDRFCIFGINHF